MNQQGLLWNVHYVASIVVRKETNFQSAVIRSKRSSCLILMMSREKQELVTLESTREIDIFG